MADRFAGLQKILLIISRYLYSYAILANVVGSAGNFALVWLLLSQSVMQQYKQKNGVYNVMKTVNYFRIDLAGCSTYNLLSAAPVVGDNNIYRRAAAGDIL